MKIVLNVSAHDGFYDKLCLYNKFDQENTRSFLKC